MGIRGGGLGWGVGRWGGAPAHSRGRRRTHLRGTPGIYPFFVVNAEKTAASAARPTKQGKILGSVPIGPRALQDDHPDCLSRRRRRSIALLGARAERANEPVAPNSRRPRERRGRFVARRSRRSGDRSIPRFHRRCLSRGAL